MVHRDEAGIDDPQTEAIGSALQVIVDQCRHELVTAHAVEVSKALDVGFVPLDHQAGDACAAEGHGAAGSLLDVAQASAQRAVGRSLRLELEGGRGIVPGHLNRSLAPDRATDEGISNGQHGLRRALVVHSADLDL